MISQLSTTMISLLVTFTGIALDSQMSIGQGVLSNRPVYRYSGGNSSTISVSCGCSGGSPPTVSVSCGYSGGSPPSATLSTASPFHSHSYTPDGSSPATRLFKDPAFGSSPSSQFKDDSFGGSYSWMPWSQVFGQNTPQMLTASIVPASIRQRQRTSISLSKVIANLEDLLIRLHESNRLGSFDIDVFSKRLLYIKHNYSVMAQASGHISISQQRILRRDLRDLRKDISKQAMPS